MGSQDMRHAIDLQKLLDNISAKGVACSTWREGELVSFWIGIGPDEIGHRAFVGDFSKSVDDLDLIDGMNGWRQTAMHAEDLVVDDHTQGQKIEHVGKVVPDIGVSIFPCTLSIKTVGLGNAS